VHGAFSTVELVLAYIPELFEEFQVAHPRT
jgi:hypothetical protein